MTVLSAKKIIEDSGRSYIADKEKKKSKSFLTKFYGYLGGKFADVFEKCWTNFGDFTEILERVQ